MVKIMILTVVILSIFGAFAAAAENGSIKIKVTVGERVLTATLIDNATSRELVSRFPLTLPMIDLYSREMVG